MTDVIRVAVWSGPRNISTALMRAWENRPDTVVVDEPLYAHYLAVTGRPHPGREQVIAHHETDWKRVIEMLVAPQRPGTRILYQKQMSHHLLPDIGREWLAQMTHAFLIRDPRAMLASLSEKLEEFTLADTGLPQQIEIFDQVEAKKSAENPTFKEVAESQRAFAARAVKWDLDTNTPRRMAYNHYFAKPAAKPAVKKG